jgi:hypothetical protein
MISFTTIVNNLKNAASTLAAVNTVDFGSIDLLDANWQNAVYPYVFFRPLTSPGITISDVSMAQPRRLNFEMYIMDVPLQTDADLVDVMSNTEQIGYDILTDFYDGSYSDIIKVTTTSIVPLFEAFQDRAAGWVFSITIETAPSGFTSCNRTND